MEDKSVLGTSAPGAPVETSRRLPRRDLWLLPAISLLTIIMLFAGTEIAARTLWPEQTHDQCQVNPSVFGRHFKPNCTSKVKVPEGPWINNFYNDCGYRTRQSCSTKPAGTVRVAVLGSSSSFGYMDPYEDTYTTLLGDSFSKLCKRPFEFQDLGYPGNSILDIYHQTDDAIALKPDMMLVVITAIDLRHQVDQQAILHRDAPSTAQKDQEEHKASWLNAHVVVPLRDSRAVYMMQNAMFRDPETYLKLYLLHGDDAGFIKSPFSPAWQERMANFDLLLGDMSRKASAAGIPMALLIVPGPADVAVLYTQPRPGVDPKAFQSALSRIAADNHVPFINGIDQFAGRSNPMGFFYLVNGHLQKTGEKMMAEKIEHQLPDLVPSVFQGCSAKR